MTKLLIKKQLMEIFRGYFYDAKKNRARSRGATIGFLLLFAVLIVGLLGGTFAFLAFTLCAPLASANMDWLYFAVMGLVSILLGTFGSVFNTYSGLYLAKDNDLLLSMPIPAGKIMTARLLGTYLMGVLYSGVVSVPAAVVYCGTVSFTPGTVIGGALFVGLISVLVLMLSCLLGYVVALVSQRLKRRSFLTAGLSLLFFAVYYVVCFRASDLLSGFLTHAAEVGSAIRGALWPIYCFGRVGTGDGLSMLLASGVILVLFALLWWAMTRSFLKLATVSAVHETRRTRARTAGVRSPSAALVQKELRRFAASPNYMLNCGLGTILLPLFGLVFFLKRAEFLPMLRALALESPGVDVAAVCAALCALIGMNDMAAPSISLEAKTLWLAQSLPITPWQTLQAKLEMQLLLTAPPALVCLALLAVGGMFSGVASAAALLVCAFLIFHALFALVLGLKLPNLHWTNEITPIKQSLAVMLTLLGGVLYAGVLIGLYLWVGWRLGFFVYGTMFAGVTVLLSFGMLRWLKRRGSRVFAAL